MKIHHFGEPATVSDLSSLNTVLAQRFGAGINEFWLSEVSSFPTMSILVNEPWAALHYFPRDGHPGFISQGNGPIPADRVVFHATSLGEKLELAGRAVVSIEDSLRAAQQFFETASVLPAAVEWLEL